MYKYISTCHRTLDLKTAIVNTFIISLFSLLLTKIMIFQNVSIDNEAYFFVNVYQHDWYMGLAIAFSCINFLGFTPLFYLIIWYERYGSDHPRTLLNLLVNSICWNGILNNLFIIPIDVFLDLFGPMNVNFCLYQFVLKNTILCHLMLLLIFIIVVKYLSIYVLKNPTEIMNNFWNFFINIASLSFSFCSQIVFVLLPGRNPINYFICIGTYPRKFEKTPQKIHFVAQSLAPLCMTLYIALFIKVKIISKPNSISPVNDMSKNAHKCPQFKDIPESNTLASLGSLWFSIFTILPIWFAQLLMISTSPEKLSMYPYQILIHLNLHGNRFIYNLWTVFLFMSKSNVRRSVVREMLEQLSRVKENLGIT